MAPPPRLSPHHFVLIALLMGSLAIRLGWALSRSVDPGSLAGLPDQVEYLALGRNLLHAGALCFDARFGQTVWAFRMPGYPWFIAACGGSLRVVRGMQALIDTSTVLAVYLLARRVLPGRPSLIAGAGRPGERRHSERSHLSGTQPGLGPPAIKESSRSLWAAGIVACNPFLIYFTGLILSETLFAAMIAWGMVLLARPAEASGRRIATGQFVGGILLLVMSVLVRPEAVLLPSLLAGAAIWLNGGRRIAYDSRGRWPSVLASAGVAMLLVLAVLLPWSVRNARVLGRAVWLTTNGGITLYDGNHPGANGGSNQKLLTGMPGLNAMSETERNAYFTNLARHFIEHHPIEFAVLAAKRLARTWSPAPLSDAFASRGNVAVALAYAGPLDVLVLLGLISSRLSRPAKVFLLMPAIYLTAVHMCTVGSLRYRIPAEPPMAIVAAVVLLGMRPSRDAPPAHI